MTYDKKYSLGIYVNDWGFMMGSEGNPHVFLGLKIEKVKCNNTQIKMQEDLYQHYLKYNMLEQANQCKINIEQMQCFIADTTLFDLQQELSKYKYYFDGSDKFKAWRDTELDKTKANAKDFDEALRKEFNDNFTFLRQCYADITEPFFIWVKNIKNRDDESLQSKMSFDEFESLFNEFIESSYNNLDSIEGFFGFGPYHTSMWNNYEYDKHDTGGKVFQNNHWNDEFKEKTQDKYEDIKDKLKDKILPRIPQDPKDKQYLIFSKDFTLTTMRPLKTFQEDFSEIIEINQNEYEKIAKQILFHTLLSSDSIRQNAVIFSNEKNEFKNYKVVGNSCVDFVMDKLQLIGASKLDKEGVFIESKPVYHLQASDEIIESTSNNRDSNNSLSTLQVFLDSNTLTLLNYSLLDSSLNIKLECNSSESKVIQEKEKAQREQQKQDSKAKDSQSTSMLHPILEDTEIKCPHNGVVQLKSNRGKSFTSKGIPMVLESDLLNASIIGCAKSKKVA